MAENAGAPAPALAPAPAPAPGNGTVAFPPAPKNTSTPDNAAAEASGGSSTPSPTPTPGDEMVHDRTQHGSSYRLCKKCLVVLPTRWKYWQKKRDPATPRGFWFFVAMAWRCLLTSKCPECKSKGNRRRAPPQQEQEESPIQTGRQSQEEAQGVEDVGRPE
ncbi:hypothetical protein GX51_02834 [Blastomyces parvus]|uniref:Uncharacterized protein n=1 Tax=Blastomyces parvus TaxID=2060905 RepID=A0A2B7X209_9EURO|nr:hypothetical protein GX51_02834 [Blastomyces parvus]